MSIGNTFVEKLNRRISAANSLLCVGLDPVLDELPPAMHQRDDPIFAFNKWLIELCSPYVCAFKLNSAFYEAAGRSGWSTLKRTIDFVPPEIPVILDAKRGDVARSAEAYARAAFDVLGADALTVNPYLGTGALLPFVRRPERGVFILCHTTNPGAEAVQGLDCSGSTLYEHIAELAVSLNAQGNVGLVVGATYPAALGELRALAPQMLFLTPGIGAQGGDVQAAVAAGLDAEGQGMVISVSRGVMYAKHPDQAAARFRDTINTARSVRPGHDLLFVSSNDALVLALHEAGCIMFGEFVLHSGETSPIYIDLRSLVSSPMLLQRAARAFAVALRDLDYDLIAAIPYAALPVGTAVALALNCPLVYARREVKAHGTRRAIEGRFQVGERVVILDDVITTGDSKLHAIAPLQSAGLSIRDVVVLVDREQGGAERLAHQGYRLHSILTLSQVLDVLLHHRQITEEQYDLTHRWLSRKRDA